MRDTESVQSWICGAYILPDYESTGGCQPYSQLIGLDRALT